MRWVVGVDRRSGQARRLLLGVLLGIAVVVPAVSSAAAGARLGPIVRVTTPGMAGCHSESETAVAATAAGTWVAYNDVGACQVADNVLGQHITHLQLLPAGGGPARLVTLPALELTWGYLGDPALAADVDGAGVVLASLAVSSAKPQAGIKGFATGTVRLEVLRVSADGTARRLPGASGPVPFDDKEAVAVDRGAHSPRRGWVYVVWDDTADNQVSLRAFDGRRWLPMQQVSSGAGGHPDVSVGPTGAVAVAYEVPTGVEVRVADAAHLVLGRPGLAIAGPSPGHVDPSCPLINSVGVRQRVIRSPRLAWDTTGRLHLVAAIGIPLSIGAAAVSGVDATVVHAVSGDGGRAWRQAALTEQTSWAPAIAALPGGDVAIGYLQLADSAGRTFTAHVWHSGTGSVELSQGPAALSVGSETTGTNYCYGLGDYSGLAARRGDVAYAWASTAGAEEPVYDSDVLVRRVSW